MKIDSSSLSAASWELYFQTGQSQGAHLQREPEATPPGQPYSYDRVDISEAGREAAARMQSAGNAEERPEHGSGDVPEEEEESRQMRAGEGLGNNKDPEQAIKDLQRRLEELQERAEKLKEDIEALKAQDPEKHAEEIRQKEAEKDMISAQIAALMQQLMSLQGGAALEAGSSEQATEEATAEEAPA